MTRGRWTGSDEENVFQGKADILNKVEWNDWFFKPGMPPVIPEYDTTLACACNELADRWSKVIVSLSTTRSLMIKSETKLHLLCREFPIL